MFFFALLPGIPGLDESYLPRWIGYGFGSLLLLNHFLGSDAAAVTPAQLVREIKAQNCIFVFIFHFLIGQVYLILWGVVPNCYAEYRGFGSVFGFLLNCAALPW